MGKRINIYFKDENIIQNLMQEENVSNLIEKLLKEHYNQSIEGLERQKADLTTEINIINSKINKIKEIANSKLNEENRQLTTQTEEEYKNKILKNLIDLWKSNKITDEEYFNCFEEGTGKLILKKAGKYIK
jgi:hypothetical protein